MKMFLIMINPFQTWIERTSFVLRPKCIDVYVVDIHSVHIVDQHVELLNAKVNSDLKEDDEIIKDQELKETCCVRDSSVGILVELNRVEDNTKWSLFVNQPW
mmetsp:Transcript_35315/g.51779  ORF Transcript_35315/g.51779 Transcript_35315/m.51779 type:complete len:102 (-) Transcript_35315:196-501(-)